MGSRHLVSTTATATTCSRCGAPLLTGWAEGLLARVEATPLAPAAEIAALLKGLATYNLIGGELVYRDQYRIRGASQGAPIHAQHKCHLKAAHPKQMTLAL